MEASANYLIAVCIISIAVAIGILVWFVGTVAKDNKWFDKQENHKDYVERMKKAIREPKNKK